MISQAKPTQVVSPRSHRSGRGSTCGWEAGIVSMVVPQTFWPPSMPPLQLVVEPTHLTNIGPSWFIFPKDRGEDWKYLSCHQPDLFFLTYTFPKQKCMAKWSGRPFCSLFYKLHFRFQSVAPRMSRDSTHWKAAKCRIFQIPQQDVQSKEHCWHNSIGTTHLTKL